MRHHFVLWLQILASPPFALHKIAHGDHMATWDQIATHEALRLSDESMISLWVSFVFNSVTTPKMGWIYDVFTLAGCAIS